VDDSDALTHRNSSMNRYYELEKLLNNYESIMEQVMPTDIFESYEKSRKNWNEENDIFIQNYYCGATKTFLSVYQEDLIDLRIRQVLMYFDVYLEIGQGYGEGVAKGEVTIVYF
tara:strand:- start:341 stop:682 length:342 start_codon:yes stop_codon:yes gene_type:complete